MRNIIVVLTFVIFITFQTASAEPAASSAPTPFNDLQVQIDSLLDRVQQLEGNTPSAAVEGRSYCMMVNVSTLRGLESSGTETEDIIVVRRAAEFLAGMFTATLVSSNQISQDDNGIVTMLPGNSPDTIAGTYTQAGRELIVQFPDGTTAAWYASADGSVIHNSGIEFFGPFPNTLSLGLVRSSTLIESDTCAD
ncbi:MAG: hypothetical protein OEW81_13200 [Gammaproteobacteria bacterium]|nr:hypothetical protein [Gammaproteobacteria bacterium]